MDRKVVKINEDLIPEVMTFLREYFLPEEPCAKALSLCPHGYRLKKTIEIEK